MSRRSIRKAIKAERVLAADLRNYIGQYVAVADHRLVASAETLDELLRDVEGRDVEGVFLVPEGTAAFSLAEGPAA